VATSISEKDLYPIKSILNPDSMRRVCVIPIILILLLSLASANAQVIQEGEMNLTMQDLETLDASFAIDYTLVFSAFDNSLIREMMDVNGDNEVSFQEVQDYFFLPQNQSAFNWNDLGETLQRSFLMDGDFPESIDVEGFEILGLEGPVENFTVVSAFMEMDFTLHFNVEDDSTHRLVMGVTQGQMTDRITFSFTAPLGWWITDATGLTQEEINDNQVEGIIDDEAVTISFSNEDDPIDEDLPFLCLTLIMVIVIIIVVVIAIVIGMFSIGKKRRSAMGPTAPQTFQVACYYCRNTIQVTDMGYKMNVTCPYCSATLSVESRVGGAQAPIQRQYPPPPGNWQ
jgi:ribosomal protein S27E